MNHTATFIETKQGFRGDARLYRLSPPISQTDWDGESESHEYVIVSAIASAFDTMRDETYIFPADSEGNITSWGELDGSFQGEMDHEKALSNAGYTVA